MSGDLILRHPRADDVAGASRVHVQCWQEAYRGLFDQDFLDSLQPDRREPLWASMAALPSDHPTRPRVALVGDDVIGVGISGPTRAEPHLRDAEVQAMYVLAQHYGTGVGQRLLEELLDSATPAQLWVAEGNERAIAFYRKNGFELTGDRDGPDELGCTELLMVR